MGLLIKILFIFLIGYWLKAFLVLIRKSLQEPPADPEVAAKKTPSPSDTIEAEYTVLDDDS